MKRLAWLLFPLVVFLLFAPLGSGAAQAPVSPFALQSQGFILHPSFINVWTDTVGNHEPAVAYNDRHDEYLVVWWNDRGATRDIYARRIGGDGSIKSNFTVAHTANEWKWLPDVAYSPVQDKYLVVFTHRLNNNNYDIGGRLIEWDGSSMSPEFPIAQDADKQWYPAVAYNSQNDEFLVVYENYWAGGGRDIAAQRVKASDRTLLSWRNIAAGAGEKRRLPDVAYNEARNEYLIAYTYNPSIASLSGDIFARITSWNMADLSSEIRVVDNSFNQDGVSVTAGPDQYFMAWEDGPDPTHRTVYGRRVGGAGALAPTYVPIADHAGQVLVEVAVAFSRTHGYLITWRRAAAVGSTTGDDILARLVDPGQYAAVGGEFELDIGSGSQRSPAVACTPLGSCFYVQEDDWGSGNYEIRGRFLHQHETFLPQSVLGLRVQ